MTATYVYRAYDKNDRLLYVGQSQNPMLRWRQHLFDSTWWAERATRWQLEVYPSREQARAAERDAIEWEHPIHNLQHFGAETRRRWSQQQYIDHARARLEVPYGIHTSAHRALMRQLRYEYRERFGSNLGKDAGTVDTGFRRSCDDTTTVGYRPRRRLA